MSSLPVSRITPQEYVDLEEKIGIRHEYRDGHVFAMAGGTETHALIAMNIGASIRTRLRGTGCRIVGSDLRVVVAATASAYYPDLMILCGDSQPDPRFRNSVTTPRVLFEILSRSTAAYDRGVKAEQYAKIPSLQAYVLVSQTEFAVDLFERQGDQTWLLTRLRGEEAVLEIRCVHIAVPFREMYDEVSFQAEEAEG
jgi:Uma2 family endonuclease